MKIILLLLSIYSLNVFAAPANSAADKTQLRLFVGQNNVKPTELNDFLKTENLQPFLKNYSYGIEITQEVISHLNLGLRYEGKYAKVDSKSSASTERSTYYSSVQSSNFDGVLRVDIVKSSNFKFDLMGGVGFVANQVDISAKNNGEGNFTRTGWHEKAGASIGIGAAGLYLMGEAGYEWNSMGGPKREGKTPDSVNRIDFSGPYLNVGVILTGEVVKLFSGLGNLGGGSGKK